MTSTFSSTEPFSSTQKYKKYIKRSLLLFNGLSLAVFVWVTIALEEMETCPDLEKLNPFVIIYRHCLPKYLIPRP